MDRMPEWPRLLAGWPRLLVNLGAEHYLQVIDEHYAKAAQNPAQSVRAKGGKRAYKKQQTPVLPEEYGGLPTCTHV